MSYPDFEEFIESLNANRVRYLIVGGYALGFHARPRATKDLDVLIDATRANATRAHAAIIAFLGAAAPGITVAKLMNPRTLVVLGIAPVRIDVLTAIDGVTFAAAWKRRVEGRFGATRALFISFDDLLAAKRAAGRPQDLVDVATLTQVRERAARSTRRRRAKRRE